MVQERMIQMRRRKPTMEPITMPAMAPPLRVVVPSARRWRRVWVGLLRWVRMVGLGVRRKRGISFLFVFLRVPKGVGIFDAVEEF